MMRLGIVLITLFGGLAPYGAAAQELALPVGARLTADRSSPLDSYSMPVAPFSKGTMLAKRFEGQVTRQSWRIDSSSATVLQILTPLRASVKEAGFEILLDCNDEACGGFDFRFATEVLPAPNMYVDIRDYHFLSAVKGADQAVSILVSRSGTAGYVQVIRAGGAQATVAPPKAVDTKAITTGSDLASRLAQAGHVALADLEFETGSARLGAAEFVSLEALAAFLTDNPGIRIALVGHTDSVGGLDANIALSRQRAASVKDRMVTQFGVAASRMEAEGMGYLSPVASNLTAEGRDANRRVEAVILSSE